MNLDGWLVAGAVLLMLAAVLLVTFGLR